eukprot:m.292529 g.292529  ORF g.292529 m.292529 type:complete len:50 (+) comp17826_c0_seq12:5237-5386(+)
MTGLSNAEQDLHSTSYSPSHAVLEHYQGMSNKRTTILEPHPIWYKAVKG